MKNSASNLSPEKKYLAIKNWERYQPKLTKSGHVVRKWIKDYTEKDNDHAYSKLTLTQRYLFDALCRLRGRRGENIPNDPAWISTALMVSTAERRFVRSGCSALAHAGFLIPTNQPLGSLDVDADVDVDVEGSEDNSSVPGCEKSKSAPPHKHLHSKLKTNGKGKPDIHEAKGVAIDMAEIGKKENIYVNPQRLPELAELLKTYPREEILIRYRNYHYAILNRVDDREEYPDKIKYIADNFIERAEQIIEVGRREDAQRAKEDAAFARAAARQKAEVDIRRAEALKDDEDLYDPELEDPLPAQPVAV